MPETKEYRNQGQAAEAEFMQRPASGAAAVTEDNTTPLANTSRALYIGGDGDLTVTMLDGTDVEFVGVVAGTILPIRVTHVKTATTATNIINLY